MSLDTKISALTARLKGDFYKSWQETAVPAEWEDYTYTVPSNTRIEHQIIAAPVPGMSRWAGTRSAATIDSFVYSLQNETWNTSIEATQEDLEDDQVGYLYAKPKELVNKARIWPGRLVLRTLAAGGSTACFDGSSFFANSHNFGTGDNSISFTTADSLTGSDTAANTYKLASLYYGDALKPMLWQNRSGPDFETDAGSPEAKKNRKVMWWCDMRGVAGFGWWWHAIMVTISGLPSITEMHDIFRRIRARYKTFVLPKASSSDDGEYIHEQTKLKTSNHQLVGSPDLEEVVDQAVNQDWVPQSGLANALSSGVGVVATKNNFQGFARTVFSNYF
jgi:phage major head subunit gpT-like protein